MKLVHIDQIDINKTSSYTEFHFDLSAPVEPSLGANTYVAHFIDPTSIISDVRIMNPWRETSDEVK